VRARTNVETPGASLLFSSLVLDETKCLARTAPAAPDRGVVLLEQQPEREKGSDMQFQLVYTNAGWNARLFNARGELVFWTREYDYKQEVIDICDEVRMGVPHAPIRDADTD
jgi:hypothetical protein